MTLVGGMGTMLGPVIGAFVLITMESHLSRIGSWVLVIQGIIFMVVVILFRQGIMGQIDRILRQFRR